MLLLHNALLSLPFIALTMQRRLSLAPFLIGLFSVIFLTRLCFVFFLVL